MKPEAAETLALNALGWLAGQDALLPAFLAATGASLAEVAQRAGEPEFLGAVLDFLLAEDARVIAFCDSAGLPYGQPMQARAALPGGASWHWT
jgi:hypothetical protein